MMMNRRLQQRPRARITLTLNFVMAEFAQCYEITQVVSLLVIAVEQSIANDVMDINYCLFAGLLLFAAYLALFTITDQRRSPLIAPRWSAMFIFLFGPTAINIRRIMFALSPFPHTFQRAETTMARSGILSFMNRERFSTLGAGKGDKVLRPSSFRVRYSFARFTSALKRAAFARLLSCPDEFLAANWADRHDVVSFAGFAIRGRGQAAKQAVRAVHEAALVHISSIPQEGH
jgi:uncharacterized membrane protein YgdD (TMEM256/DUF423 family)